MPVYNEARFLAKAIESLLAQDYQNLELIISDNASTDRTSAICEDYASKDSRVRYHRNSTNIGSIDNFNRVLELARGEFFMWASGHDMWEPLFISRCALELVNDSSVVLSYPRMEWIDTEDVSIAPLQGLIDTRGLVHRMARFNTVLWGLSSGYPIYGLLRAASLRKAQRCQHVVSPDTVLLAELALIGAFANVPELLFYARRLEDYGNWELYLEKHFRATPRRRAAVLYVRMFRAFLHALLHHCYGLTEVALSLVSVFLCMLTKNRWMLTGLLRRRR